MVGGGMKGGVELKGNWVIDVTLLLIGSCGNPQNDRE